MPLKTGMPGLFESLGEISDEVIGMFKSDRKAQQVFRRSGIGSLYRSAMLDQ